MNLTSSVALGFALLAVSAVVFATFAHKYDISRPILHQSFEDIISSKKIQLNDINGLKGNIISLQYNKSSMPVATISGKWQITEVLANNTHPIKPNFDFTSNFTLTRVDGLSSLKYQLREFKNFNIILTGKTAIINGSISLIPKSQKSEVNPNPKVDSVPLTIEIMNLESIIIKIHSDLVKHYLGDTPIYGTVPG